MPIPKVRKPEMVVYTFRIPRVEVDRINALARAIGYTTPRTLVRQWVLDGLDLTETRIGYMNHREDEEA